MKNVNDLKISIYSYLLLVFVIMTVRFFAGCTELPSKSEGPDNPLDPSNPANSIEGPALILSPTQIDINRGENFQLELWIVEANAVAGMSTRIIFDHEIFNVEKVDELGEGYVIHFDSSSVDSSGTGSESFKHQKHGELKLLYYIDTQKR